MLQNLSSAAVVIGALIVKIALPINDPSWHIRNQGIFQANMGLYLHVR